MNISHISSRGSFLGFPKLNNISVYFDLILLTIFSLFHLGFINLFHSIAFFQSIGDFWLKIIDGYFFYGPRDIDFLIIWIIEKHKLTSSQIGPFVAFSRFDGIEAQSKGLIRY